MSAPLDADQVNQAVTIDYQRKFTPPFLVNDDEASISPSDCFTSE